MTTTRSARPPWLDPLVVASVLLMLAELVWFALNLRGPVGPPLLGGLPIVANAVLATVGYRLAWRTPGLARPAVKFWRTLTLVTAVIVVAMLSSVPGYRTTFNPAPPAPALVVQLAGFVTILAAMYRLPLGIRHRGERIRLAMDAATVTIAALLVAWYCSVLQLAARAPTTAQYVETIVFATVMSVMVLAVVKVVLAGDTTVDPVALHYLGAAFTVEMIALVGGPLVPLRPDLAIEPLGRAAMSLLVTVGTAYQRRGASTAAAGDAAGHRRISMLPYLAVAAVDGLLLYTLWGDTATRLVIGAGAVALTVLVIIRQLAAFRENSGLLDELAMQERRFRSLVQNAGDAIGILDRDGVPSYLSPAIERLTGSPPDAWVGRAYIQPHPDDVEQATLRFRDVVVSGPGATNSHDARVRHPTDGWRWVRVTYTNRLDDPAVRGVVTNLNDITEVRAYHDRLIHQASHDTLTDLANRALFSAEVTRALAGPAADTVTLALIDLDDFKSVNDTFGHHVGDGLLMAVADRLRRSVRPDDLVARLGGDEFAVLLEQAGPAGAEAIAERILAVLTEPLQLDGNDLQVNASIGLAESRSGDTIGRLMHRADTAMYTAKAAGKSRFARYSDTMTLRQDSRAQLVAGLDQAIAGGGFELHYQPIVNLPGGAVVGVEALLRWHHPELGVIPPMDFIPVAERTGLIVPIGRWVLTEACRQAAAWLAEHPMTAPTSININVSPRQLREPGIVEDVVAALRDSCLSPERVVVEVTESAVVGDRELESVLALRAAGVRIALDDFGTGASTLSLLDRCPVDQLKLDSSFVAGGPGGVATAVARIAESLGLEAVAEGVEAQAQAGQLYELGYRLAQGYLFHRPSTAAGIGAILTAAAGAPGGTALRAPA